MSPANATNYYLKNATKEDLHTVSQIITNYGRYHLYYDSNKTASVKLIDDGIEVDETALVLEFLGEDLIRVKEGDAIDFLFRYKEGERQLLLEQLVLMTSGYRIVDPDILDMEPVFRQGVCGFRWVKCSEDTISLRGEQLTKEICENLDLERVKICLCIGYTEDLLNVGKVLDIIEKNADRDNTCIIVTTDGSEDKKIVLSYFYPLYSI